MKKKISVCIICIILLGGLVLWGRTPKNIDASKIINLVQSNYESITVNDKKIESGTKHQYLIDDFIPKLSRYTLKKYNGELPKDYSYKVDIKRNDGSEIILFDNNYLVVDSSKYQIIEGNIDLNKFYTIFME
ncbi:hypothetical protein [Clostridium celatum]|uniref:Uncharacterized protein n=1 Tax=Clostridium celatum DSM 1785 TaxID=545697 RepID=L1QMW5_9CLOT|nr:hypothetical protein [Clostridium celatum]EKY29281.1 hypothetical protein HMPREF0216_00335 [Clostridium celatum DSM 1785]MCE9656568.1 hypothetical protein [Clostridium celatum]MDU2266723.1 hypothetical protein [Clostridium celatum]MDU6297139.1 hypothetical protein [Clostridium celatum]MDY3361294.1 hypothetical protein [Clostridium celatum]